MVYLADERANADVCARAQALIERLLVDQRLLLARRSRLRRTIGPGTRLAQIDGLHVELRESAAGRALRVKVRLLVGAGEIAAPDQTFLGTRMTIVQLAHHVRGALADIAQRA